MKFLRRQAKYSWQDYKTNENSLSEFKFIPVWNNSILGN